MPEQAPARSSLLFSRDALLRLIIPLVIEQLLLMTVGMADTVMVTTSGEAAVSGVSLVDNINTLIIQSFPPSPPAARWWFPSIWGGRTPTTPRPPPSSFCTPCAPVPAADGTRDVGRMIEKNFGGVRIDGTNATIIGAGDGNFIADRNGIARVWMDHALWPQMTTKLYIDQTGDVEILNRQAPYFKDAQAVRGTQIDAEYQPEQGGWQRTSQGEVYTGTILEHLLIEQLAAFYEVGEHNICRLRGADWNDALDMGG